MKRRFATALIGGVAILLILLLTSCGPSEQTAKELVPVYLRALASDDLAEVRRLSWAEPPGSLDGLREDAFGTRATAEIDTVTLGEAISAGTLGEVGGSTGDTMLIPATVEFEDGRSVRVLVPVWVSPGKQPSLGPAWLNQ